MMHAAVVVELPRAPAAVAPVPARNAFRLQPIVHAEDLKVYGYEFLFSGNVRPASKEAWTMSDTSLVRYLGTRDVCPGVACFVNLSHESLLSIDDVDLVNATRMNDIRYEISEDIAEEGLFEAVCVKVNRLTERGLNFVVDDFGAGLDGLRRMVQLDHPRAVKIDRNLLVLAARKKSAAGAVRALVHQWNETGVLTIAEGVESHEIQDFAYESGFKLLQGYHIDKLVTPFSHFF